MEHLQGLLLDGLFPGAVAHFGEFFLVGGEFAVEGFEFGVDGGDAGVDVGDGPVEGGFGAGLFGAEEAVHGGRCLICAFSCY